MIVIKMLAIRNVVCLLSNAIKRHFSTIQELENLYTLQNEFEEANQKKKLLKIAILGLPNTGKSTLINQLVKRPVCAASCKIHTTRVNAFAIYNENNTQLIFIDTPGLVSPHDAKKFDMKEFKIHAKTSMEEADVIGIMQDMEVPKSRQCISKRVLDIVSFAKEDTPFILILNKIDLLKQKQVLLEVVDNLTNHKELLFSDIFMVSALKSKGIDDLRNYFLDMAKPQHWKYDDKTYTDQTTTQIIERILRAKLLDNVRNEIPYTSEIKIQHLDYDEAKNMMIIVQVMTEKLRHVPLIIGEKAKRIRIIGLQCEQELCSIFRCAVKLKIFVIAKDKPKKK